MPPPCLPLPGLLGAPPGLLFGLLPGLEFGFEFGFLFPPGLDQPPPPPGLDQPVGGDGLDQPPPLGLGLGQPPPPFGLDQPPCPGDQSLEVLLLEELQPLLLLDDFPPFELDE